MPSSKSKKERARWDRIKLSELEYRRQLKRIARYIGDIVKGFEGRIPNDPDATRALELALQRYARTLDPWARSVAERMVADVSRRDAATWKKMSRTMGRELHKEIQSAPIGAVMRQLVEEQVGLIKSLPLEAAQRVQKLAIKHLETGDRHKEIVKEIMKTGEVTKARAEVIARTETGRAATSLTQARAMHVGSEGYIWQTSQDEVVRKSHKKLRKKFIRWDSPPSPDGLTGHAGALPNCRCYPEPVVPDDF